jgi:hypothetical protein
MICAAHVCVLALLDHCIATESSEIALCICISFFLGTVIVPVLFALGDKSATLSAIVENALGLFFFWTVQIMIFGPKVLRILTGTADGLPSMATTNHARPEGRVKSTVAPNDSVVSVQPGADSARSAPDSAVY